METHRHTRELPHATGTEAPRDTHYVCPQTRMVLAVGPEGVGEEARAGGCGQDRFQGGRGLSGRERVSELEDTSPPLSAHSCNWQSWSKAGHWHGATTPVAREPAAPPGEQLVPGGPDGKRHSLGTGQARRGVKGALGEPSRLRSSQAITPAWGAARKEASWVVELFLENIL